MLTAETNRRYRPGLVSVGLGLAAGLLVAAAGCGHVMETGYADQGKTQIQFYSPPGATVTVRACPGWRTHQVGQYGPYEHRLEFTPEEFSVFNLSPGTYEFKYVSADGLPGVSVYGELDVRFLCSPTAKTYQRRSFVPISLPSQYYARSSAIGNEIFPYRGEAYRTAIDELDLQRLKQGDVVEKVFIVADLEDAAKDLEDSKVTLAVLEREMQYAQARYRSAYFDFRLGVDDSSANFWGTDREFIKWEAKRQKLQQKFDDLNAEVQRRKALMKGDNVIVRKGMLAVATQEIVEPYEDVVSASSEIGEVMLVMRVGGRHMHWGDPAAELAAYQQ